MRFSKCLVQIREQPFKLIQTSIFKREACHLELGSRETARAQIALHKHWTIFVCSIQKTHCWGGVIKLQSVI